jgi:hypothetical protein
MKSAPGAPMRRVSGALTLISLELPTFNSLNGQSSG